VDWILEGSVRKTEKRVQISVRLVNARDGYTEWAEIYDRALDDILNIQTEIAAGTLKALKIKLGSSSETAALRQAVNSLEAFDCHLRGRYFFYKHTADGWLKAIKYFERATAKEPGYASAYAGLSSVLAFAWFYGAMHPDEAIDKWTYANERALTLGSDLEESHIAVGRFRFLYERNWSEAEREYNRAITINPDNADAYQQLGLLLASRGQFDQAIAAGQRALALESESLLVNFHVAAIYWLCSRWTQAMRQVERMIGLYPDSNSAYWVKGYTYSMTGDYTEAIKAFQQSLQLRDDNHCLSSLAFTFGISGERDEAQKIIKTLTERWEQRSVRDIQAKLPYATAYNIAIAYGGLREDDAVIKWLEQALRERDGDLVYMKVHSTIGGDGIWGKAVSSTTRFADLLRRAGFIDE
jgi:adenylate cyclase